MRARIAAAALTGILAGLAAGCINGPNDRCYIDDRRYREARRAFERTSAIDLTRQAMEETHWPEAMIHEAIYRIEKEFGLKDSLPSPVRVRSEEELRAEEERDRQEAQTNIQAPGLGGPGF